MEVMKKQMKGQAKRIIALSAALIVSPAVLGEAEAGRLSKKRLRASPMITGLPATAS